MTWTQADLTALEKAIAQGTQRVEYEDKEIEYRSLKDMLILRDVIRRDLGIVSNQSGRVVAEFSKGLSCK